MEIANKNILGTLLSRGYDKVLQGKIDALSEGRSTNYKFYIIIFNCMLDGEANAARSVRTMSEDTVLRRLRGRSTNSKLNF